MFFPSFSVMCSFVSAASVLLTTMAVLKNNTRSSPPPPRDSYNNTEWLDSNQLLTILYKPTLTSLLSCSFLLFIRSPSFGWFFLAFSSIESVSCTREADSVLMNMISAASKEGLRPLTSDTNLDSTDCSWTFPACNYIILKSTSHIYSYTIYRKPLHIRIMLH